MKPTIMAQRALTVATLLALAALTGCANTAFKQPQTDLPAHWKQAQTSTGGNNANAANATNSANATIAARNTPQTVVIAADGSRWKTAQSLEAGGAHSGPMAQWWQVFNDATLDQLINEANRANQGLAQAAAHVKQARALAGMSEAARLPQVNASVGANRSRQSSDGTSAQTSSSYAVGLGASYEVDLFGRLAAAADAAQLDAAASSATYRAVMLALQADVAQNWFNLRAVDAELLTLQKTVQLREEAVQINLRRHELGESGEFDLVRARTELSTARAELIGLQQQRVGYEHALAVLQGKAPARFSLAAQPLAENGTLPTIPAGLPSSLLERRPDIVAAQRAMEAAYARTGQARAAMFPVLSLNADANGTSNTFSNILSFGSRSFLLGALASMPLFDGGRREANIRSSEAALEADVAGYRQNVLRAFAEVEDNLARLRILASQAAEIDEAVLSARRSQELAQKLYAAGRSGYLDLLDAQRNLASIERNAVQLRGRRSAGTVALIRALGGGWEANSIQ